MTADSDSGPVGTLALPQQVLEEHALRPGDIVRLSELGGIAVRAIEGPSVTDLALEIERARIEAGLTMEELLDSLYEERERYTREKYGSLDQ
jgi:hypothetical protein